MVNELVTNVRGVGDVLFANKEVIGQSNSHKVLQPDKKLKIRLVGQPKNRSVGQPKNRSVGQPKIQPVGQSKIWTVV